MDKEMININGNLVKDVDFTCIYKNEEEIQIANFSLVLKDKDKNKSYVNCNCYGEKCDIAKEFRKGDLIHVYGYYKEVSRDGKTYNNFIVKSLNKIENKMEEK